MLTTIKNSNMLISENKTTHSRSNQMLLISKFRVTGETNTENVKTITELELAVKNRLMYHGVPENLATESAEFYSEEAFIQVKEVNMSYSRVENDVLLMLNP